MFDTSTKTLIIDDMLTMRKIVSKALKDFGFKDITEASDGMQGWESLSTANPPFGLVISDWNMPKCTGIDLLKKVRADTRFKTLPFILLTAETEQHQVMEAIKAGVNNYVIKPFTAEILKMKLEATHKKLSGG